MAELVESDMFARRLAAEVIGIVGLGCGGEDGFDQAIEMSSETLANVHGESGAGKSTLAPTPTTSSPRGSR